MNKSDILNYLDVANNSDTIQIEYNKSSIYFQKNNITYTFNDSGDVLILNDKKGKQSYYIKINCINAVSVVSDVVVWNSTIKRGLCA